MTYSVEERTKESRQQLAEVRHTARQTERVYMSRFTGRNHVAAVRGRTPRSESISCVLITRAEASGEWQL